MAELRTRLPDGEPLLDLAAICNMNEVLAVRCENERRASKAAERKAKSK